MTKPVRVAVIGCGMISDSHCNGVKSHPDAELVAVCDVNHTRATQKANAYGVKKVFHDIKDVLTDSSIDAVTIALPNELHVPVAVAALQAGKHVCTDKPFAPSFEEASKAVEAAKKAGKILMVGMNMRFAQSSQIIKAVIENGDLGDIYHARSTYLRRFGVPKCKTWFIDKPQAGGGCLYDIGVHVLDVTLYLLNNFDVETVSGTVRTEIANQKINEYYNGGWGMSDPDEKLMFTVDDFASAFIRLKGGQTMELSVSWALTMSTGGTQNVQLYGTKAGAEIFPNARVVYPMTEKTQDHYQFEVVEPQGIPIRYPKQERFHHWIDVILGNAEPCVTMDQALMVQKTLDAIYESAKEGKEVRLS